MFKSQATTPAFVRTADALTKTVIGGVLAAFVTALPLAAQQSSTAKAVPAPAVATAMEDSKAAPTKPGVEGITVHGHWVFDLKDKDGKLIEHREFENALLSTGAPVLAGILSGTITPGGFAILATNIQGQGKGAILPAGGSQLNGTCTASSTVACSTNLAMSEYIGTVLLSGSFVAASDFTVTQVSTQIAFCGPYPLAYTAQSPAAPAACANNYQTTTGTAGYYTGFTGTTLASPLAMVAGQTLAITVTLSFS